MTTSGATPLRLDDGRLQHLRDVADLPDLGGTRYESPRRLARGGMGTIYAVRDTILGRDVAMKVLSVPDPSGDLGARLMAEARHLATLEHPNIVPVHDAGVLPDGRAHYVMTLVRGRRLDEWRAGGPSFPAMLRLFQKVCGAVAFAHAHGVIHRDLKPENIMVGPFGEALVMDWGVAKAVSEAGAYARRVHDAARTPPSPDAVPGSRGTLPGAVIGTPAWMSPEQARGETDRLDARTDVHALGAILHYLIAGRPPFEGDSPRETLRRVIEQGPPRLRQHAPSAPRPIESICMTAMAREPEDRYRTAQQMSDDVERFLDGQPVAVHRETLLERGGRLIARHRTILLLVAAYLIMRVTVLVATGR